MTGMHLQLGQHVVDFGERERDALCSGSRRRRRGLRRHGYFNAASNAGQHLKLW